MGWRRDQTRGCPLFNAIIKKKKKNLVHFDKSNFVTRFVWRTLGDEWILRYDRLFRIVGSKIFETLVFIRFLRRHRRESIGDRAFVENRHMEIHAEQRALNGTHSLSASATVHLYCAVENKQMSANCLTDTLIFFTVRLLLFAMCTFTAMFSPWWYSSLSRDASRYSLFGDMTNSLLTSTDGCSPCFDGAYMIFRIASLTESLQRTRHRYQKSKLVKPFLYTVCEACRPAFRRRTLSIRNRRRMVCPCPRAPVEASPMRDNEGVARSRTDKRCSPASWSASPVIASVHDAGNQVPRGISVRRPGKDPCGTSVRARRDPLCRTWTPLEHARRPCDPSRSSGQSARPRL